MKFSPVLVLFLIFICFGFSARTQQGNGLTSDSVRMPKPEVLYLTAIGKHHYRMRPAQVDSLVRLKQVKNLRVMSAVEGTAIYGARAEYGLAVVELVNLKRKQLRWLKSVLGKF